MILRIYYHSAVSRESRYRQLVLRTVRVAAGPLSANEVHQRLQDSGIGLATVYRLLNKGLADGDLVGVDLPNGPKRFEPAERPHHHYFECVVCRAVFGVIGCLEGIDRLVPDGFELEQHDLILTGRCRECV